MTSPRRPPQGKAPLCKGSWHGAAVTEGLSGVAGGFGDNPCSDSNPFLHQRRKRSAVRRWPGWLRQLPLLPVGADAYIGPLPRTICDAPVGRGDHTPPPDALSCSTSPVGGGLRPAPLGKVRLRTNFPLLPKRLPHRVGADLCVRPDSRDPSTGRHIGRPLQNLHQFQDSGRGRSPAPTGTPGAARSGPMPMTDAPNFGTKFGRRRPCPRYIGPYRGFTGRQKRKVPSAPSFFILRLRPGRGAWLPRRRISGRGRSRWPSCCASSSGGTWRPRLPSRRR